MTTVSSQASTMATSQSSEFSSFLDFVRSPSPSGDAGDVESGVTAPVELTSVESVVTTSVEQTSARVDDDGTTKNCLPNHSRPKLCKRRSSTTEERRNPFAVREGNNLVWNNVSMTLRVSPASTSYVLCVCVSLQLMWCYVVLADKENWPCQAARRRLGRGTQGENMRHNGTVGGGQDEPPQCP